MFDTYVTIVGTVLHDPEKRITNKTNTVVATFRVATHPRRYDPKLEQWVDAPSLRLRVNCWRRLAEHVTASVHVGDPVVVYGRISTREWKTEQGETRLSYEMDADNVGHDLSRGLAQFSKARAEGGTSVIEDRESDSRVNGELTSRFGESGDEGAHDDRPYDDDLGYGDGYGGLGPSGHEVDALTMLRAAGLAVGGEDAEDEEETAGADADPGGVGPRGRRRGRQPVPA